MKTKENVTHKMLERMAPLDVLSGYLETKDELKCDELSTVRTAIDEAIRNIYEVIDIMLKM